MSLNFQVGALVPTKVKLGTATAYIALAVTDHSFTEMVKLVEVQNASLGGRTGRLVGYGDSSGNVTADFDLDLPPYAAGAAALNVVSGNKGFIEGFVTTAAGNRFWQFPIVVESVEYAIPSQGKISFKFSWKEDALTGSVTLPVVP